MKNKLLDLFKGFLIGFDSTIPGFSIGTLAILLNIYERLIDDFSDIVRHPFKIIKKDIFLGLGFIVGFVLNILTVSFLLTHFPLQTVSFFVGLVLVSIPGTFKNATKSKLKVRDILSCVIALGFLIFITLLNGGDSKTVSLSFVFLLMIFFMGAIGSGTMIIPGVSGSLIIMAFGYYDAIMILLNDILHAITHFEFAGFGTNIIVLLVFIIGVLFGIVLISKLIKFLLKKTPSSVYSGILGLLIGSPFAIYYLTITNDSYPIAYNNPWVWIISVITLSLGILFGIGLMILDKKNKKQEETEEIEEEKQAE